MRKIRAEDAVGAVLVHDLTQIIPGQSKGPRFRKGHVVTVEDIPILLSMGKEHIYVWEKDEGLIHENEAAERLARAVAGPGLELSAPREGKVSIRAQDSGLLYVDEDGLLALNSLEQVSIATLHTYRPVTAGQTVGGTRVIPLMIAPSVLTEAERVAAARPGAIMQVKAFRQLKTGIVTTGSEVYHGRIEDKFGPVLRAKLATFGCPILGQAFAPDDANMIRELILMHVHNGAELILVTGGMSVDPDDVTPTAIKGLGAELVAYGAPVLPGAMFLLAYLNGIPVLGLPGCVMYAKTTVFDLILPRVLAGERLMRQDIARLGHGGLCLECPTCSYPHCSFGK